MKKLLTCVILLLYLFVVCPAFAIESPFTHPNNKFGVHILFPSELSQAASLVNSQGGDWGYVTIPIQSGDKDRDKWQTFFNQCAQYHLIPIIRLATQGDYFNTTSWRKPTYYDIIDFANFLGDLNWPTKNRYIIVYNEVNRGDEWGGQADATDYADLLQFAVTAFKARNPDFFIISAGLDNAAANTGTTEDEYTFLSEMNNAVPGIFGQIDGFGSHSYPNPGFSTPPWVANGESIDSFHFEQNLVYQFSGKELPVFITETGWSDASLSQQTVAQYYLNAFSNVWSDPSVVAVTPFLLDAGSGPFVQFSLINTNGTESDMYKMIQSIPKTKGQPDIIPLVYASVTNVHPKVIDHFGNNVFHVAQLKLSFDTKLLLKWLLHM